MFVNAFFESEVPAHFVQTLEWVGRESRVWIRWSTMGDFSKRIVPDKNDAWGRRIQENVGVEETLRLPFLATVLFCATFRRAQQHIYQKRERQKSVIFK